VKHLKLHDSEGGVLGLIQSDDGDVTVYDAANPFRGFKVHFCTAVGGGATPRTLKALRDLMRAAKEDIEERFPDGEILEWEE